MERTSENNTAASLFPDKHTLRLLREAMKFLYVWVIKETWEGSECYLLVRFTEVT